jgi:arabinosaccharide transport system substrate-binding protein
LAHKYQDFMKAFGLARVVLAIAGLALLPVRGVTAPLEIWISSFQDKVYYEEMVRLYQAKGHKDFEANIRAYGFREMPDKLAVAIKTGVNPPDIVQLDEVLFGMYLNGEVPFVELSDRIKKAGLDKDIVPNRLSLFAYQGKTYGIPQSLSAMVMYYRTDVMAKHYIAPEDIATWDDFMRVGEDLGKKGQAMLALDPSYFEILLRQRGSDWFGKDGKVLPDEELATDTLRFLREMQEKRIAVLPDRASIFDPVFFSGDIANGEVFCVIGADWYGLDMIQQFSSDLAGKWGVMPLPAWKGKDGKLGRRTSTFAGQGLMIYKNSKKVDESWGFMEFVMKDKEANVQRFTKGNSFTAYQPAWKDERMLEPVSFFNNEPFGQLLVDLAPSVPPVAMNPKRPMAVFMFQEGIFSAYMYGQIDAKEAVKQLRDNLSKAGGPPGGGKDGPPPGDKEKKK